MGTFAIVDTDQLTTGGVGERIATVTSASTVQYDYSQGAVFQHTTSPSSNWTANFVNVPYNISRSYTVAVLVTQSGGPFTMTSVTLNGVPITVAFTASSYSGNGTGSKNLVTISFMRLANGTVQAFGNAAVF